MPYKKWPFLNLLAICLLVQRNNILLTSFLTWPQFRLPVFDLFIHFKKVIFKMYIIPLY